MTTYPEWERVVLEHAYEAVDHISLHMYFANRAKNTAEYLALNAKLDAYIGAVASTIEVVRAAKRSRKRVTISFDEWNVWYHSNAEDREILGGAKGWPHAPRLLEDIYNFEDVAAGRLHPQHLHPPLGRGEDRLHRATGQRDRADHDRAEGSRPGDRRSTTPIISPRSTGAERRCKLAVKSPGYDAEVADNVPYLDISAVHDEAGRTLTFFAVNRHGGESIDLEASLQGFPRGQRSPTIR